MTDIITEVEMRKKGQLTIPADVRRALKIHEGQKFIMILNNNELVLIPKQDNPMEKIGMLGKEDPDFDFKEKYIEYQTG